MPPALAIASTTEDVGDTKYFPEFLTAPVTDTLSSTFTLTTCPC
jgi:hypothetical protein